MKIQEHTYKPLPHYLTIKQSPIHGLGLFASEEIEIQGRIYPTSVLFNSVIPKGTFIGISHIHNALFDEDEFDFETAFEQSEVTYPDNPVFKKDEVFPNGLIRTPLGGFINHSDDPNITLNYLNHGCWGIIASRDIKPGEELTLDYKYTPSGVIMNKN